MRNRLPAALASLSLCVVLAACSARTDVSLTGNTPAQYSPVWITTQEVWVNSSATAGPDDSGWVKFPLSTPTTVDLVQENGGNLGTAVTDLKIVPGSLFAGPSDPGGCLDAAHRLGTERRRAI